MFAHWLERAVIVCGDAIDGPLATFHSLFEPNHLALAFVAGYDRQLEDPTSALQLQHGKVSDHSLVLLAGIRPLSVDATATS